MSWQKWLNLFGAVACSVKEEVPGWSHSKHIQLIGTSSGKWNRGSPRVPARPFVSGVESRAAFREGRWREIKWRRWEGVWLRDKLWCTMEVLIFDRSSDLLKLPWGLGFRLPKGLPSPCLLLSLFLCLSLSVPLSLPLPATISSSFSLCCPLFFSLLYMKAHNIFDLDFKAFL